MRVLVVLNAGSGSSDDVTPDRLAEALRPLGDVTLVSPGSEGFGGEVRRAAEVAGIVVAAGGDGTVSRTVDALGDRLAELTLAVVPMGTGNDFARTLGMPEDPLEAPGAPLIGCPSAAASLATAGMAAWARAVLVLPFGGGSALIAAAAVALTPWIP
jgi:diacylglycerol kinase family enzyme